MQKKQNASITFPVALGGMNNVLPADMIEQTQATLLENVIYDKKSGKFKGSEVLLYKSLLYNSNHKNLYIIYDKAERKIVVTDLRGLLILPEEKNYTVYLNGNQYLEPKNVISNEDGYYFTNGSKVYMLDRTGLINLLNDYEIDLEKSYTGEISQYDRRLLLFNKNNDKNLYMLVLFSQSYNTLTNTTKNITENKNMNTDGSHGRLSDGYIRRNDGNIYQVVYAISPTKDRYDTVYLYKYNKDTYTVNYSSPAFQFFIYTFSNTAFISNTVKKTLLYFDDRSFTYDPQDDTISFNVADGSRGYILKFSFGNATYIDTTEIGSGDGYYYRTIATNGVGGFVAINIDNERFYINNTVFQKGVLPFKPRRALYIGNNWVIFGYDNNNKIYAYQYQQETNTFKSIFNKNIQGGNEVKQNFDVDYYGGYIYILAGTSLYSISENNILYSEIQCLFIQNGRLVYSVGTSLYYSAVGDFYNWETGTEADALFLEVGYKDGSFITHAINMYGNIIVVKNNGYIYRVSGDYPNWIVTKLGEANKVTSNLFDYGGSIILGTETGLKIINTTQNYGDLTISDFQNNIITGKVTHISESKERQSIIFCSDKYVFEYYTKLNCFTVYQKESYYQMEELGSDTYALKDGKIYKSTTDLNPVTVQRALIHNQYNIVIKAITLYTDTLQDDTEIEIEFYKDKKVTRTLKAGQSKHKFFITIRLKELQLKYKHNGSIFINNTVIELINVGA